MVVLYRMVNSRCILLLPQRRGITQVAFGEAVITPPCRCHERLAVTAGLPPIFGRACASFIFTCKVTADPGCRPDFDSHAFSLGYGWYRHGGVSSVLLAGALYRCYLIQFSRYREGSEKSLHMVGITPMIISENCLEAVIYDNGDSAGSTGWYRVDPEIESPGTSAEKALVGDYLKRIHALDPTVFCFIKVAGTISAKGEFDRFFDDFHGKHSFLQYQNVWNCSAFVIKLYNNRLGKILLSKRISANSHA